MGAERNRMTNAVDDAWPEEEIANLNPTKKSLDDLQRNEMRNTQESEKKKQREDKNGKYKQKSDSFEHDDEYKFTAQDMLDAAPVPVLDQKFDDVYDPFKEKKVAKSWRGSGKRKR